MTEKHNSKKPSIIGVLFGAICVNIAFIRDDVFYAVVYAGFGVWFFIFAFANELDMYLSRRAGRDPDKDYIVSNGGIA